MADLYLPQEGGGASVVIVHGGGWVGGHRRMKAVRVLASHLVARGVAVLAFDYRKPFRGGRMNEQLLDVQRATDFWLGRCREFHCDPNQVSVMGLSAGATLMMVHASEHGARYHRLVSFFGPTDLTRMGGRGTRVVLSAATGSASRKSWHRYSPSRLPQVATPLLLLHGDDDRLVPLAHSLEMLERRRALGLSTELEVYEGMYHGFVMNPALPATQHALERVTGFVAG